MKSLLFIVFCLFLSSVLAANKWEGVYDLEVLSFDKNAYICYEDGWLFGNFGYLSYVVAKVSKDGESAEGKFFVTGYKHGGPRDGETHNKPSTGSVWINWESEGKLSVKITYRGETEKYPIDYLGERTSTTVTDRVSTCVIMDMKSEENLHGYWKQQTGGVVADQSTYEWICMDGDDYYASYMYSIEEFDGTGYLWGKCSYDGRVCRSEFFEYPYWGVQLDILLSNGQMFTTFWYGPTYMVDETTISGHYVSVRKDDVAPEAKCKKYADRIAYPFKCDTFETVRQCNINFYYCNIRQSDGVCKRKAWP